MISLLKCYGLQGAAELLEDEDFQRDAAGGRLNSIVDEIKARPASYEAYALASIGTAIG